ncbi:MAG: hypothetical protein ABF718_03160 [Leuconostoc pseudomesenteroides]|uniref:hypothetical protein n=1 Tax=Leuconostoc pseudomesenteroides TaxID=33968 RepID=UPI0039ED8587
MTFTELQQANSSEMYLYIDGNDEYKLYKHVWEFRSQRSVTLYLVNVKDDSFQQVNNSRVKTVAGALKNV